MNTVQNQEVVLESDCVCGAGEGEDGPDYGECFGCYDDSVEYLKEIISTWRERAGIDADLVRIEGKGMTWQSMSGYAVTNLDGLYKALTINGDFRIEFKLEGETLTAIRYSHDEPTGASFTFTPTE